MDCPSGTPAKLPADGVRAIVLDENEFLAGDRQETGERHQIQCGTIEIHRTGDLDDSRLVIGKGREPNPESNGKWSVDWPLRDSPPSTARVLVLSPWIESGCPIVRIPPEMDVMPPTVMT